MENQKLVITKSNDLIENYIFNASELELQILNYAVACLNPLWENNGVVFMISIPDLEKVFTSNSKRSYDHYRNAFSRLMRREYSYYDENNDLIIENLIIRTKTNEKDRTWVEFKFNERISKRLSNLKELFTSYDVKHIANFKSRYAFMLYEFFKMKLQQSRSENYNQKISVEDFKKNLDLTDKYDRYFNLKSFVIEPAKLNINKHSDINISYQVIKTGKKVTHLKFTAKYKKEEQKELNLDDIQLPKVSQKTEIKTPDKIEKDKNRWEKIKQKFIK